MEIVRHKILVPAETAKLSELRQYLSHLCAQENIPPKTTRRMVLAIDEALANVIEHAGLKQGDQGIELSLEIKDDKIVAEICDRGIPFDPSPRSEGPDRRGYPRRGFGLYLIHMIVDRITYERTSDGQNVLTLTKRIE
jgi:anti-sigma regulatory factor (Ser/Thr protein kinase)